MKTKSKIIIALTAATLAGLLQAEPPKPAPAEDQAIYLLDSAAGRHVPAAQHPRFAPEKRGQQNIEQQKAPLLPVIPVRVDPA